MRQFNYDNIYTKLLTPDIVALLGQIHEFKGEQTLFIEAQSDALTQLVEIAKIQSAEASNKIEGIYTSDERLKMLVRDKTTPKSRSEEKIAGYRDVLAAINESYDYIPVRPSIILQLHRDLYKYSGKTIGGRFKDTDNVINIEETDGGEYVCFCSMHAWEAPEAMDRLCEAYDNALKNPYYDPLLLIPVFVLDFLYIHPFNGGNGRMSRLLTLLLLYRAGYIVGKYISIERLIEQSKAAYYETLNASERGWNECENDYIPFVRYLLGVVLAAYRELSSRVQSFTLSGMSKPERIAELIKGTPGKITKTEIMEKCPDISQVTVQRTLNDLQKSGKIIKISGGRYTAYTWNRENE